jgi:hypothetical protein
MYLCKFIPEPVYYFETNFESRRVIWAEMRNFSWEVLREGDHSEDLGVVGRIL